MTGSIGDFPVPLRVAVVTGFPPDPSKPCGGVEAVSVNLVRALARFPDLRVDVVTTDRACRTPGKSIWEGVEIHRLPWTGEKVFYHTVGPGRTIVKEYLTQMQPDVIHAHDIYGIMVRGMNIPRVFTVHGFISADTLQAKKRFAWIRSKLWKYMECTGWADQPHIISISPYVRERLSPLTSATIHDIENPIARDFFDVQRNERKGTVFCAALICPRKNILGLIEAFERITSTGVEANLRIAGACHDPEYEKQVHAYIREKKLGDRVTLLGGIGSQVILRELSSASVFALTSLEEGAPMAVAEAMAVGVPVVASNRCGMPYMVRDGETGFLVNPKDPDDIAARIGSLLNNDSLRDKMRDKARQVAAELFHPHRVAIRTREVYFQAVKDYEKSIFAGER